MPDKQLQWIIDHSEYHKYEDVSISVKTGDLQDYMSLIHEGVLSFYMNRNSTLVHYFDF